MPERGYIYRHVEFPDGDRVEVTSHALTYPPAGLRNTGYNGAWLTLRIDNGSFESAEAYLSPAMAREIIEMLQAAIEDVE